MGKATKTITLSDSHTLFPGDSLDSHLLEQYKYCSTYGLPCLLEILWGLEYALLFALYIKTTDRRSDGSWKIKKLLKTKLSKTEESLARV